MGDGKMLYIQALVTISIFLLLRTRMMNGHFQMYLKMSKKELFLI